jgi:tRNA G18 (ribose-2'-O)-methylase SpoU
MTLHLHHITSVHRTDLEPYRTLKRPIDHQQQGIFIAEGEKVVRRLAESTLCVRSILLTKEWFAVYESLLQSRRESIEVYIADKDLMETIVGYPLHKGIMALAEIPERTTIAKIVAIAHPPFLFAAVDGIMNSENLGVIVRNCASFGVQAILVGETSCDPYLRRAVRNSMGNVFVLPIVQLRDIAKELSVLRSSYGTKLIAAHPREGSKDISMVDLAGDCCVVFGSEGNGISEAVLAVCDEAVTIPMMNGVDSINVGSASAVLLYEVRRQRSVQ